MTRRITIARNGVVRLRGKETRWRVRTQPGWDWFVHPAGDRASVVTFGAEREARAYLESLTDEELRG